MQINLTDDRKRLLIAAGTAIVIHIIVLVIAGLNKADYSPSPEYGPISVQISLERPNERIKPPEPVESFDSQEAPDAETADTQTAEVPAVPVPAESPSAASAAVSTPPPVYTPPATVKAAEPEKIDIEAIKNRSSGNSGGIDPRAAFGDDRVPAVTDQSSSAAASYSSGGEAGSAVVLSDAPQSVATDSKPVDEGPSEVSVVDSSTMTSLDQRLSNAGSASTNDTSADSGIKSPTAVSGSVSGNSAVFTFSDPSISRRLLEHPDPVIPDDVAKSGVSKYTIVVEFLIDSDGLISDVEVIGPSGDTRIDAAFRSALRRWLFRETSADQKKVKATLTYVIEIK